MGGTRELTDDPAVQRAAIEQECPRCAHDRPSLPAVHAGRFRNVPVHRCERCGSRYTAGSTPSRLLVSCSSCGLPCLVEAALHRTETRCEDCTAGRIADDLPDRSVAAATEREVVLALDEALTCVTSESLTVYLRSVIRTLALAIPDAPPASRVLLVDHDSLETLALPSGTLLVGRGFVASLADEAQLAFVLAHELAHVASGAATRTLVRLGLGALTEEADTAPRSEAWVRAAMDLIALGHGRKAEFDADRVALEAMRAAGYDPRAAVRFLKGVQKRMKAGDPAVQEYAVAHPLPSERIRALESAIHQRFESGAAGRTNREVFRRAAMTALRSSDLDRLSSIPAPEVETPDAERAGIPAWVWIGAAILAAVLVVLGIALI